MYLEIDRKESYIGLAARGLRMAEKAHNKQLQKDIDGLYKELHKLRMDNGFYRAANSSDYNYSWLRDNFYCSYPELTKNPKLYQKTYHTWLDYYKDVENKYNKFTALINKKRIDYDWEFPNPRIDLNLNEIHNQSWGHVQLDTISYFLSGIAQGERKGIKIIRDKEDREIINKSIKMLDALDYHKLPESGIWEETKKIESSGIGAVVSGLTQIKDIGFNVPDKLIENGKDALKELLPKESENRDCDLALLTLIYPFNVVNKNMAKTIVKNVEGKLVHEDGTKRYIGDQYHNYGSEARWTLGNLFLGIIYADQGNYEMAQYYYDSVMKKCPDYKIPEMYHHDGKPGINTPLGWSLSLAITLAEKLKNSKSKTTRKDILDTQSQVALTKVE